MFGDRGIELKSPDQVATMREAGLVVGRTLQMLREAVRPGMTTLELDRLAEDHIRSSGATPSFKGYHGFPGSLCTSVNDVIVHGIPDGRVIADGDLVSIDCGAIVDGWHGDAAITVAVGEVSDRARELSRVTEEAMWRGIAAAALGGRVTDISHAVETYVRSHGSYGIVEEYVGHGIGSAMHQPPNVPNLGRPGKGPRLVQGMALAVEPMVTLGASDSHVLDDDWTVKTDDGSLAAHWENTFTLTRHGTWVLTEIDGGRAKLAQLDVPFGAPPN
jgi:methionyl aminopeptidase